MNLSATIIILDGLAVAFGQSATVGMFKPHVVYIIFFNNDDSVYYYMDRLYLRFEPQGAVFTRTDYLDRVYLNVSFLESRQFYLFLENDLLFEFYTASNAADLSMSKMDEINYTLIAERAPNALQDGKIKSSFTFPISLTMLDADGHPASSACANVSFAYPVELVTMAYDTVFYKCIATVTVQINGFQSSLKVQPQYNSILFDEEHMLQFVQGHKYIVNANISVGVICMFLSVLCAAVGLWKLNYLLMVK